MGLVDGRERELCQTCFDRHMVLEAGAGTGKTATLVARILAWCLGEGWHKSKVALAGGIKGNQSTRIAMRAVSRVVAITFTEAAAAEMSARITDGLIKVVLGQEVDGFNKDLVLNIVFKHVYPHHPSSVIPDSELRQEMNDELVLRARELQGVSDQLVVQTIHAYCRSLLSHYPMEAGFHPHFQIDSDSNRTNQLVLDVLLDEVQRDFSKAKGDRYGLYEDLFQQGGGFIELMNGLVELSEGGTEPAFVKPIDPNRLQASYVDFIEALDDYCEQLQLITQDSAFPKRLKTLPLKLIELSELKTILDVPQSGLEDPKDWSDWLRAHQEALEHWVEAHLQPIRDMLKKWSKGAWGKLLEKLIVLEQHQADVIFASSQLLNYMLLLSRYKPFFYHTALLIAEPLYLKICSEKKRMGLVSFSELLLSSCRLLRAHRELVVAVRSEIDMLLVDEFQDTSSAQCELISLLIGLKNPERFKKDGPILFIVGDPKQSIYGWRDADISAYFDFCDRVLSHSKGFGEKLYLRSNFRSKPSILAEVERLMLPVMVEVEGVQPAFIPLAPVRSEFSGEEKEVYHKVDDHELHPLDLYSSQSPSRGVEYWSSWKRDDEEAVMLNSRGQPSSSPSMELEAKVVAEDIALRQNQDQRPWSDFAILMRSSTHQETLLNQLKLLRIPYVVSKDRSYYRRREIIEAVALLRVVFDPTDQIALVALFRHPLTGVPDAALFPLWQMGLPGFLAQIGSISEDRALKKWEDFYRTISAMSLPCVPRLELQKHWPDRLNHLIRQIIFLRKAAEEYPIDRFIAELRLRVPLCITEAAAYQGIYRLANLDHLFLELHNAVIAADGDWTEVLNKLKRDIEEEANAEESRPKEAADNAVQIMTIHRSKGLGFSQVYLIQAHGENKGRIDLPNRILESGVGSFLGSSTIDYAKHIERQKFLASYERVRLLYVAMTRAKDRLVISGMHPFSIPKGADSCYVQKDTSDCGSLLALMHHRFRGAFADVTALDLLTAGLPKARHGWWAMGDGVLFRHTSSMVSQTRKVQSQLVLPSSNQIQNRSLKINKRRVEKIKEEGKQMGAALSSITERMSSDSEDLLGTEGYRRRLMMSLEQFALPLVALGLASSVQWERIDRLIKQSVRSKTPPELTADVMVEWLKIRHKLELYSFPKRKTVAHDLPVLIDPKHLQKENQVLGYCEYHIHLVQEDDGGLIMVELCVDSSIDKNIEESNVFQQGLWRRASKALEDMMGIPVSVEMWSLHSGRVHSLHS